MYRSIELATPTENRIHDAKKTLLSKTCQTRSLMKRAGMHDCPGCGRAVRQNDPDATEAGALHSCRKAHNLGR